jgi:adenine-specific DNA-methyltransferase
VPQLQFKSKAFVQNHHLLVKYHELVPVKGKSLTDKVSLHDNLIIHGDNLKVLKALLPLYAGKVKCVYIDPPYNTGNEGWAYNDNVSSPMMQEWLGKVVDREDLTRHDKWLCMMMPRLKLIRELMTEDGVIFISIDDNELAYLRMLMDEIFGGDNYLNTFCWVSNLKGRQISGVGAAKTYEYVLAFAKNIANIGLFEMLVEKVKTLMPGSYKGFLYETGNDKDGGFVLKNELYNTNAAFNEETRPNLVFNIHYNFTTKQVQFSDMDEDVNFDGFVKITPKKNNDGVHQFHAWRWSKRKIAAELSNLMFVKTEAGAKIYTKIRDYDNTNLKDIITDITTSSGSSDLKELFGDRKQLDYPKPVELIKIFVNQIDNGGIVLDSFAGSGTTGHAVLALNAEDGGNRRFILVECEDYADSLTAERVRRAIKGVPSAKDEALKKGLGGSFSFFELGKPLELESILGGESLPSYKELARYVFYTATGEEFDEKAVNEKKHFIGESRNYQVYLFYEPDLSRLKNLAFTLEMAKALPPLKKDKKRLVFAPTKYLDQELLDQYRIDFAQLPFEIYELTR